MIYVAFLSLFTTTPAVDWKLQAPLSLHVLVSQPLKTKKKNRACTIHFIYGVLADIRLIYCWKRLNLKFKLLAQLKTVKFAPNHLEQK